MTATATIAEHDTSFRRLLPDSTARIFDFECEIESQVVWERRVGVAPPPPAAVRDALPRYLSAAIDALEVVRPLIETLARDKTRVFFYWQCLAKLASPPPVGLLRWPQPQPAPQPEDCPSDCSSSSSSSSSSDSAPTSLAPVSAPSAAAPSTLPDRSTPCAPPGERSTPGNPSAAPESGQPADESQSPAASATPTDDRDDRTNGGGDDDGRAGFGVFCRRPAAVGRACDQRALHYIDGYAFDFQMPILLRTPEGAVVWLVAVLPWRTVEFMGKSPPPSSPSSPPPQPPPSSPPPPPKTLPRTLPPRITGPVADSSSSSTPWSRSAVSPPSRSGHWPLGAAPTRFRESDAAYVYALQNALTQSAFGGAVGGDTDACRALVNLVVASLLSWPWPIFQ